MENVITTHRLFYYINMNKFNKFHIHLLLIIMMVLEVGIIPTYLSQPIHQSLEQSSLISDGQILYAPMFSTKTYLIDTEGNVNNIWDSIYFPGVSVWWLNDEAILRTIRLSGAPGGGGGVQILSQEGTIVWDYRYTTDDVLSHHDVKSLPNGNILLIAWEKKTKAEAITAGRNPDYVNSGGLSIDHIIEVLPTGPTSGDVVWEWHAWDHLIQDFDPSKNNYGILRDHPELIDFNYVTSSQWDLMHTNSIDYNEEFDQILLSVCYYNELWVIDHSTTTQEAAGHTGGNSGKGGDLLYRWGNPQVYDRGTSDQQKLFMQHDATWIQPTYPGEGNILVFNNEVNGHSSIDEITPPVNSNGEYSIEENASYAPIETTWSYTAPGFYAGQFGGATRLATGNTLITNGETGLLFEVNPLKETVWHYNTDAILFKAVYIPPQESGRPNLKCSGTLSWTNVHPEATVTGTFQVQNIGDTGSLLNWTINNSSLTWGIWSFSPQSGKNLTPEDELVTVDVSVRAPNETNTKFEGYLRVENIDNPTDYELIPVTLKTPVNSQPQQFKTFFNQLIHFFLKKTVLYDGFMSFWLIPAFHLHLIMNLKNKI